MLGVFALGAFTSNYSFKLPAEEDSLLEKTQKIGGMALGATGAVTLLNYAGEKFSFTARELYEEDWSCNKKTSLSFWKKIPIIGSCIKGCSKDYQDKEKKV